MPHLAGLAGLTYGNGLELLLNVDADGNLTGMRTSDGSTVVQDLTFAYDAASAITAITDNLDASRSQSFDYDGVGRLVWADGAYGEIEYGYDLVGNRTRRTVDGGATADDFYAYESGSHRLASVTSGSLVREFDYTAAGSTLLDTRGGVEVEFGYGASGRLVQVTSDTGPLASRTYGYDAAGKRVRETRVNRLPGGGGLQATSHDYVYDLDGRLLAEYSTLGLSPAVRREYVWLGDTPVAMVDHAAPGDPLLAIHTDHLGRPQKLTDASQAVVWDGQFDPFGEEHAVTGTTDQPLRFPGQEWDAATGLSQNWNRDYDPTLGRYIESDPIGLEGGVNTFAYATATPATQIDATGLSTYRCSTPLKALGEVWGPRIYSPGRWNPLYHEYACVLSASGTLICGGLDRSGNPFRSPGLPSSDPLPPSLGSCQRQSTSVCMDDCVSARISDRNRPPYGIGPLGTDCQEWLDDVFTECHATCGR